MHLAPYRACPRAREIESHEIDKMLVMNVIELSQTECAAFLVFVSKKDRTLRSWAYFGKLNIVIIWDCYLIPCRDECIHNLKDAQIFLTLDANRGFWHVEVTYEDRDKTAFESHRGVFRFTRMPFGQ